MRILFLESDPMWIHGLPNGFRDLGHHVRISGPINGRNIPIITSEFRPDLIITIGWGPENDSPEKQDLIGKYVRASGVPHIYWATEDPGYTITFSLPCINRIQPDFVFTICPERITFYKKLGIESAHLDFGFHPSTHFSVNCCDQYRGALAIVANGYPQLYEKSPNHFRFTSVRTLVEPLLENNFRIDFYGRYWDLMKAIFSREVPQDWIRGYLPYTEANKVYSSVDIVIGPQNLPGQLTQRTYEILGSGGFLITSDTPAVRRLFEPGRDLVVSASKEDTLRLVHYYLKNPEVRQKIQERAKLAVAKHSYKHRAEYILDCLVKRNILQGYVE